MSMVKLYPDFVKREYVRSCSLPSSFHELSSCLFGLLAILTVFLFLRATLVCTEEHIWQSVVIEFVKANISTNLKIIT
jgi:hypothetical protein